MREDLNAHFEGDQKEVVLPGIDTKVRLPAGVMFRYDGEVYDLRENIARNELIVRGEIAARRSLIQRALHWPKDTMLIEDMSFVVGEKLKGVEGLLGYCYRHKVDALTEAYVIATRKGLGKSQKIFATGHESGEFLDNIEQYDVLQKELDENGIRLDVRQYHDEDFADIGGLLALFKAKQKGEKDIAVPVFRTRNQVLPELVAAFGF